MGAIVASMQEGADAVESGRSVITRTGGGMRDLNGQIGCMNDRVHEISSILTQQSAASREIAEAVGVIAAMTAHNVSAIDEVIDQVDECEPMIAAFFAALSTLEIKNLTVHVAKSDHVIWRKKLAEMLVGRVQLDPRELADHHHCRLGKWVDGLTDARLKQHPAFGRLEEPHRAVHAHGIEAARRYQGGDLDGAVREVEKAALASKDVLRLLDELSKVR